MRTEFTTVPFEDPAKARANLDRLLELLPARLHAPLASLLSESPDPDAAVNMLERYTHRASPETLMQLARYPAALSYLVAIFGYSRFLSDALLEDPGLPLQFAQDRNFTRSKSKDDLMQDFARFSTTHPGEDLSSQLARFKRRNYLRLVLKDVLGIATLGEITLELSELADVIIANALLSCDRELTRRFGQPQYRDAQGRIVRSSFSIISLGKLGGNELNYSSDIDLLFLYSHDGETSSGADRDSVISNKEYFGRLASAVARTIDRITPHGLLYRVDLRLRPEGEQGDLAVSLSSALEYYECRAREWEQQMLIKARHTAGSMPLTREFLRQVEPYVYGSATDFAAVESVLLVRERITKKLQTERGTTIDVKLHRGGIRDIEFLSQCLQRLHGGHDPWVRSGGTLFALRKLNDKGWLSDRDYATLTSTYEFLRKIEHRLQLDLGQQTHRLPGDSGQLERLARRVGIERGSGGKAGSELIRRLEEAMARVEAIYQRVIYPSATENSSVGFALSSVSSLVGEHGPYVNGTAIGLLEAQAPQLAALVRELSPPERPHQEVMRFVSALSSSAERFRLVREHPEQVSRALELVAHSDYFAEAFIRRPEAILVLPPRIQEGSQVGETTQAEMGLELASWPEPFPWIVDTGLSFREKMALLRREYRSRTLALGARDMEHLSCVYASLKDWSTLATRAVASALGIAWTEMRENRSSPTDLGAIPFFILGLGRMGISEFDLASDADLVFVIDAQRPRDEIRLWTRLAEKTIEVLSSYTRDGIVFAVDTRLRPRGQEGELVVSDTGLVSYLGGDAQVWEALTYLKACPLAGNMALAQSAVSRLVQAIFDRFSAHPELDQQLAQMRQRLETEVMAAPTNLKTAPGGYYDVNFAVSFLRLRHRKVLPPGSNKAEQIKALHAAGLLSDQDARQLKGGAAFLRAVDHASRLTTGRALQGPPEQRTHLEALEDLGRRWRFLTGEETLLPRLMTVRQQIRSVYQRILGVERG